jgi:5-methylcytosine-specific restriction endonuclease McrA
MPLFGDKKRKYDREWMRARRKAWFDVNDSCKQCGSKERLELDHIDPKTKITHNVWSWNVERRNGELKKCQVLCHECHKEKTKIDLSKIQKELYLNNGPSNYKYSNDLVKEVFKLRNEGFSERKISNKLGIARQTINHYLSGRLRTHLNLSPKNSQVTQQVEYSAVEIIPKE